MKNMRGLGFWKNFTYRVKIEFYKPKTKQTELNFVTAVNYDDKTFEFNTLDEIKKENKDICVFNLEEAVELMNSMVCNGFSASIEPYFV